MEKISKSQKKRDAQSLLELGQKLVNMKPELVKSFGLPKDIFDAVMLAKSTNKHGALKRQIQYIGALLRRIDPASIQEAVQAIEKGTRKDVKLQKQVEQWRDELVNGNDTLLEELLRTESNLDREQLTDFVSKARAELNRKNPSPVSSRALFRYLHKKLQPCN